MDREKVINGLRSIKTYLASQAIEATDSFAREGFIEIQKDIDDALALLKEQEDLGTELTNAVELIHKKNERIEKLLKEQEAVEPDVDSEGTCSCGNCGENVGYYPVGSKVPEKLCKYCPECGKAVKWE